MADYKLLGPDESTGIQRNIDGACIPNDNTNSDWKAYLIWKAIDPINNIPDPQYSLSEAKSLCNEKAQSDYEAAIDLPYNDGVDDIDCTPRGREKISNAKHSGKTSVKVKINRGRPKTLTDSELDDLIDAIDDRDDTLLDTLDSTLDAIEAAETLEDLAPYMP